MLQNTPSTKSSVEVAEAGKQCKGAILNEASQSSNLELLPLLEPLLKPQFVSYTEVITITINVERSKSDRKNVETHKPVSVKEPIATNFQDVDWQY
jgi:hypothetical protein